MPNSPWNYSHLSRVLQFLYCANTATSEFRSHTKNSSVRNPTRPRPGALCLGWGHPAYGLTISRTLSSRSPGASGAQGRRRGLRVAFLCPPPPIWGRRLCLFTHFPREMLSSHSLPAAWGRRGERSPSMSPAMRREPAPSSGPGTARRARALTPTTRLCPAATPERSQLAWRS